MRKVTLIPETVQAGCHLNSMGRDEMNLAEFPIAALADRPPRGCKTLVFEDCIWDHSQSQYCGRRLTISASDLYGLPTALDDEVILGLIQLTKAAGFTDRRVRFSRYQLIRMLGWRDEGRSYLRLKRSLNLWAGVTLYYEHAWWDKSQKRWTDATMHLLDNFVPDATPQTRAIPGAKGDDKASSFFTWSDLMFQSFQAGYLKKLDFDFCRRLKLSVAKRMFRFLDKRFHHRRNWRFDLAVFACTHIGVSRCCDAAQLKRRLNPAIRELEQAGFLTPLPMTERYHRLRRGEWEVVFERAPGPRNPSRSSERSDREYRLIERGVAAEVAARLVRKHPDRIDGKIAVFDVLRQKGDRRISKSPAGYLVTSILRNYPTPADVRLEAFGPDGGRRASPHCHSGVAASARSRGKAKVCHVETSPAVEYLGRLSGIERANLEAKAMSQGSGLPAEGYRRATAAGNTSLAEEYRRIMIEQHVKRIIASAAAASGGNVTQASA